MTRADLLAALPPRAAEALLLARQFDRDCDPAAAWLMAVERPGASPDALARGLRAQARRHRRAGGEHGPARFASPEVDRAAFEQQGGDDPADLLEAVQEVGQALAAPDAALRLWLADVREADTTALAAVFGVTQRRGQQIKARAAAAAESGQLNLFHEEGSAS